MVMEKMQYNNQSCVDKDSTGGLSDAQAKLYDRQIRLWGFAAQEKIQSGSVLIAGVNATTCEVAKNVVLAGFGTVKIMDNRTVDLETAVSCCLFYESADIGSPRAETLVRRLHPLNPNVTLSIIASPPPDGSLLPTEAILRAAECDVVVVFDPTAVMAGTEALSRLGTVCASLGKALYVGANFGMHSFFIADLGVPEFEYYTERQEKKKLGSETADGDARSGQKRPRTEESDIGSSHANATTLRESNEAPEVEETVRTEHRTAFCRVGDALAVDGGSSLTQSWSALKTERKRQRWLKRTPALALCLGRIVVALGNTAFGDKTQTLPVTSGGSLAERALSAAVTEAAGETLAWLNASTSSHSTPLSVHTTAELKSRLALVGFSTRQVPILGCIVAGVLSQELIKAVSHKGEPINNCFIFNGWTSEGTALKLG
eukprot:Clim_evm32s151 gene=Clim_evmTU32s151